MASGTQRWRDLLFLHWPVPAKVLRALIPDGLELDTYKRTAYVGVVPFLMRDIRPTSWWPRGLAFNFLETNVRTYIRGPAEPGVFFFSLEASSRLAVWAARVGWGLPYHHARMSADRQDQRIEYSSRRRNGTGIDVAYDIGEVLGPSEPNTLDEFLLERYFLYVERRGTLMQGEVIHDPYPVQRVEVERVDQNLTDAVGIEVTGEPLAHFAAGVDVEVFPLEPTET